MALPLHDIPVTAALIHPWISPPLSNWVRADARIKIIIAKRFINKNLAVKKNSRLESQTPNA